MRLFIVVVVAVASIGCGKDQSDTGDKSSDKPTMKAGDVGAPDLKPDDGSGELPATPVSKAGDGESDPGAAVKVGGDHVEVKAGAGVAVKAGSDGVAVKAGAEGVRVKAGAGLKVDLSGDDQSDDDCVAKCVRANQMRAVGADQIDSDCKAECKKK